MNIKLFKDVQVGDIATDYDSYTAKVIDKGTVKEMVDKYKFKSPGSLEDYHEAGVEDNEDAVVLEDTNSGFEGYTAVVYVYGYQGAYVEEPK